MTLRAIEFRPGVVKDDTELASRGYATDSDQVRFVQGRAEALGGFSTKLAGIAGKPRACHEWTSVAGVPFLAIATTTKLYVHTGTRLVDITPQRDANALGADPLATVSGSPIVTVTDTGHGSGVGDTVYLRGLTATGGLTIGGLAGTMGASAFNAVLDSRVVRVQHAAHGLADNDIAFFLSATTFAGIPDTDINSAAGLRVRVLSADSYQFEVPTYATSTGSGGGTPTYAYAKPYLVVEILVGGNSYTINAGTNASSTATGGGAAGKSVYDITIGRDSTRQSTGGYGAELYGAGLYGRSTNAIETDVALPLRQWSLDNMGDYLIANIVGSLIYAWPGVQGSRAAVLAGAPAQCLAVLTTPERYLHACGCTSAGGVFDPTLVRHSDGENITSWVPDLTNNAGSYRVAGSQVVGVRKRNTNPIIFTDSAPFAVRYEGEADALYKADQLGEGCGLAAINAVAVRDSDVFWLTPSLQFYVYRGGLPQAMESPVESWFRRRLALLQLGKLFAWADPGYEAVSWLYAAEGSTEPNSYIRCDLPERQRDGRAGWSVGTTDEALRSLGTAFPEKKPLAISNAGAIRLREDGFGADAVAVERYVTWAPMSVASDGEDGHHLAKISRLMMDMDLDGSDVAEVTVAARVNIDGAARQKMIPLTAARKQLDTRIQGQQVGLKLRVTGTHRWRMGVTRGDVSVGSLR